MTEKHDNGKPRWELLPWRELGEVVRAITHGAEKYAPNNWKTVIQSRELYTGAAMRHITAWICGESRDPESGLHRQVVKELEEIIQSLESELARAYGFIEGLKLAFNLKEKVILKPKKRGKNDTISKHL